MCGFVGCWNLAGVDGDAIEKMVDTIEHRGPNGRGLWADNNSQFIFAHRRLSVIDTSDAGHQPMMSACGRYCIVFNGEIYNHAELRRELGDYNFFWRGGSDTETFLACLSAWGIDKTLRAANGMFAFALWDKALESLILARDRFGEKPLYFGRNGNTFLFASELKAIKAYPYWNGEIDRKALALFVRYGYVPDPHCIYEGFSKVVPGEFLVVKNAGLSIRRHQYWELSSVIEKRPERYGCWDGCVVEFEQLLSRSVRLRMNSDVPLGAFLSGGIDSSTVVALMQKESMNPIKTFCIGFDDCSFNEAGFAKKIASHVGTDHTELYLNAKDVLSVVPSLSEIWDEPFADSSQIPTLILSRMAREYVTVCLSGDGGDEMLCGYNRYLLGYAIWNVLSVFPNWSKKSIAALLCDVRFGVLLGKLQGMFPAKVQINNLPDRLPKLASVLGSNSVESFYLHLVSHWRHDDNLLVMDSTPEVMLGDVELDLDVREKMMYFDVKTYLPGDILTKVDRSSMSVGLEARVPFLDHELVEYVWQLPFEMKYGGGGGKRILREVLYKYVPRHLVERPKMGFGVPIESWLRGPLKEWASDLLSSEVIKKQGFFNSEIVDKIWQEHRDGKRRWHYKLWVILMFQSWLREA